MQERRVLTGLAFFHAEFADKASFEAYRDDEGHRSFVQTVIIPNTDEVMAFDWEY